QRLHRAVVADGEVREHLPQGLRHGGRSLRRAEGLLLVLQPRTVSSGLEQPNAVPGVPLGADEANAVRRAKATLQRSGSSVRVRTKWQMSRVASSWADTTGRQRSCGSLRSRGRRGPCSASFASLRSAHSATQGPRRPRLRLPPTPPGEELRWRTRSNLLWQFARPEHGVHLKRSTSTPPSPAPKCPTALVSFSPADRDPVPSSLSLSHP